MSIDGLFAHPASGTPTETSVVAQARELIAGLLAEPWGQVSASPYETGRVASLAPWLAGHAERIDFLLATQRADGGWGPPGDYGLVPTLSAVEALLAECRREAPCTDSGLLAKVADRGLEAVRGWWLEGQEEPLPDTPAIELIVPSLLSLINGHLDVPGPFQGMSDTKLEAVRAWLRSGVAIPQKLVHALEVAGEEAVAASGIVPTPMPDGMAAVGASPGASAAWLAALLEPEDGAVSKLEDGVTSHRSGWSARGGAPVRRYLEAIATSSGGPVPCAVPITVFERGWTLSWLLRAGIAVDVPPELSASLRDGLGRDGIAAGPGLPADADTTSVALYALALLGEPREPEGLWAFEAESHFCTWSGEEGMSPTTNAHVLDAFGEYVRRCGGESRHAGVVTKLTSWLRGCQEAEGNWLDRWHVSPYYATACCGIALSEFGGEKSKGAVDRAVDWVLDTQRRDGSWGLWEGTAEETAYALQTLLLTGAMREGRAWEAVERGHRRLSAIRDHEAPLWVDKDLYLPVAIVRAVVLGALHLAERAMNITGE
ncbi:prenyltransferase/squalene oxidase repeat-containing protein [Streptosporangium sp. NPDC000396]|uniref:prenyltransferase/squalene oxidase repeat-containing protein n=1 Tax=Streptosporangium sp. NPDC000396 TaxID=3366185 RepID=UPI003699722D